MSMQHCVYCFDVLVSHLRGGPLPEWPHQSEDKAIFVSWKRGGEDLRGCLGTFKPVLLGEGLREYAIASASRDSRFDPIQAEELPHMHVAVSLLEDFEIAADYLDWSIGVHGVIAEFQVDQQLYRATFLPEIALQQGWSKEATLLALLSKSGYGGQPSPALLSSIKVTRYQTAKASLSYAQYVSAKAGEEYKSS